MVRSQVRVFVDDREQERTSEMKKIPYVASILLSAAISQTALADELPSHLDSLNQVHPIHTAVLPNGNRLELFDWEDGSVGVLEIGLHGNRMLSADVDLADKMNVDQLIWGVTSKSDDLPESIENRLLSFYSISNDTTRERRGWLLEEGALEEHFGARGGSYYALACDNNQFLQSNHCFDTSGPFSQGPGCFTDYQGGTLLWSTHATRSFHAAFCLSEGTARAYLWTEEISDECTTFRNPKYIWGSWRQSQSLFGAPSQLSWTWIGPVGSRARVWRHHISDEGGAKFDWATRFKASNCGTIR